MFSINTWSERDAGLGYIEVEVFLFNFFLFSIGSMSVSLGLSYEDLLGLGLGSLFFIKLG